MPEPEVPELSVAEQGFTTTDAGTSYGLILDNPSTTADALGIEVTINLVGANGDVLVTASESLVGIPAGKTFVVGGEAGHHRRGRDHGHGDRRTGRAAGRD